MLYPLTFQPIFKERVWGGRNLERLYGKQLPSGVPIGESWEISDRPGDVSVITNGPFAGRDLHWLMENHHRALLGEGHAHQRFPLLIKLLDAEEKLSLQVHPPADKAALLGGEPKTEMWFIADARPGAELFVGLKRGVTRAEFEQKIADGSVADCFHRVAVKPGDVMFLPSGRVHALGAGLVIFEIQQNSDTTYRVFDWNRKGLDGKARELHIPQSLQSIDFEDFEPSLIRRESGSSGSSSEVRPLVQNPLFSVEEWVSDSAKSLSVRTGKAQILALLQGQARVSDGKTEVSLAPGQFCLLPASLGSATIASTAGTRLLRIHAVESTSQ